MIIFVQKWSTLLQVKLTYILLMLNRFAFGSTYWTPFLTKAVSCNPKMHVVLSLQTPIRCRYFMKLQLINYTIFLIIVNTFLNVLTWQPHNVTYFRSDDVVWVILSLSELYHVYHIFLLSAPLSVDVPEEKNTNAKEKRVVKMKPFTMKSSPEKNQPKQRSSILSVSLKIC